MQPGKLILLCLLLFGLAFWTFLPALNGDYIDIDDGVFVVRSAHLQLTPANVVWAFGHAECANWLPVTLCSFMLDHQLYGLKPWGYHLTNVLLHALNTVLVFLVLRRLTGATWRSLLVAALFGLHPLRVESVAWISERKDMLSLMFWMLTLWAYALYSRRVAETAVASAPVSFWSRVTCHASLFYTLALGFFALGLMSKPMVVTLPCVLLLLDYWPLERWRQQSPWRLVAEKIPFFCLSAGLSAVTCIAQQNAGLLSPMVTGLSVSFSARLANALVSYGRYLGKLFWPVDLCAGYPYPDHWPVLIIVVAGLLVVGVSLLLFARRRQWPWLLIGWLWYLGTLVPVLGLVSVGAQAMADRYSYIPSIGILIALVWGTCQATSGWRRQGIGLGIVGTVLALTCISLARHQIGYWKDGVSVWQRAVTVTANNYEAHNLLGRTLFSQGRFDEATLEFQEAARLNPSFAEIYCSLGQALAAQGRLDEAIAACRKALELRPRFVAACNNLSSFLRRAGRQDEAMVYCRLAVEIEPDSITSQNNLGNALASDGQFAEAAAHFEKVLEIQPTNAVAQSYLGSVMFRLGRLDEAIQWFRRALATDPDNAGIHNNLAGVLLAKGQVAEAVTEFQAAVRLQPGRFEAHRNLGHALLKQGSFDAAIREFQTALSLQPDSPTASNDLVTALDRKKKSAAQPPPAGL